MFIVPVSSTINTNSINSIFKNAIKEPELSNPEETSGFRGVFQDIVNQVEKTDAVTKEDAYKLSIGEMDDMHTMMINAAKADVALQTMVQLRNKFLDAYSEVMRTNL